MEATAFSLVPDRSDRQKPWAKALLFGCWLALVAWFCWDHVFWRDEVRAFSLALSGSSYADMLRSVHGEGHPALWYLILRAAHDLFPYREVLPVAGAVIGIAAMAILTFASPFRLLIIALVLFSFYGAFEYVAMARNYGLSALVMFALAALYPRTRNTLWFGVIVAILCNTNVPSCILGAGFMVFRFVELFTDRNPPTRRDWMVFAGNSLLALIGAYLCFITVYPTFNDQAVSPHLRELGPLGIVKALIDWDFGFSHLGFDSMFGIPVNFILLCISCFGLVRRPAAMVAGVVGLLALKLFFYFVYISYYRHEVLYLIYLISLYWMVLDGAGGRWRTRETGEKSPRLARLQLFGTAFFMCILVMQTTRLIGPIRAQFGAVPFSRIADVGQLLKRPDLSGAIVMGDPDTMLEPLAYYADNPIWFLRQQRFGKVVHLAKNARHVLTPSDILADASRLHAATGRPIVILSALKLRSRGPTRVMFDDVTAMRPADVNAFLGATRHLARLRPSESDEEYDVYVYPR